MDFFNEQPKSKESLLSTDYYLHSNGITQKYVSYNRKLTAGYIRGYTIMHSSQIREFMHLWSVDRT